MNHKKRKTAVLFAFILLLGLFLTACSSGQNTSEKGASSLESADAGSSEADGQNSEGTADTEAAETPDTSEEAASETVYNIGSFTMEDINGEAYTEAMFQDYDLTMVNVFATWCSPCIAEIPYLEQLSQDMADRGVGVVGIVLDTADGEGGVDADALDAAKTLAEELETTYPVEPDPSVETVMKGAKAMEAFQPDWIVAMGGGSPIDAAKAMWAFYEYPDTSFDDLIIPFNFPTLRTKAFS